MTLEKYIGKNENEKNSITTFHYGSIFIFFFSTFVLKIFCDHCPTPPLFLQFSNSGHIDRVRFSLTGK